MDSLNKRDVASKEEVVEEIQALMTPEYFKKLMAYSIKRLKLKFNISYDHNKGLKGQLIEDIVANLISSFLDEGGRNWYKDKHHNFQSQLYSALDSQLSNILSLTQPIQVNLDIENYSSVEIALNDEEISELHQYCNTCLEELGADIDELLVFECIVKGLKRVAIAHELGYTAEKITQIKKRLDRKLIILRSKLAA